MRTKYFIILPAFLLIALNTASAQMEGKKSTGTAWALKGDYFDACACHYVCTCDFGGDPQAHGCEGVGAIKIKEGKYGDTSLNGLTAAFYIKPGTEWSLYVDESATEAQRDALEKLVTPRFAEVGKYLGVKTAKINFTYGGGKASLEIPNVMSAKGEQVMNNKKPITVMNGMNPLADKVMAGKASVSQFKDYNKEFKYEGRNAWFGVIDKKGASAQ
ncbi:MAG: DUF1326 domain-containing protein [Bacteroidota bacterium]